ncbi:putative holin-like toxin [Brevibacillus laterosporus]
MVLTHETFTLMIQFSNLLVTILGLIVIIIESSNKKK